MSRKRSSGRPPARSLAAGPKAAGLPHVRTQAAPAQVASAPAYKGSRSIGGFSFTTRDWVFGIVFVVVAGIAIFSVVHGIQANQSTALAPGKVGPNFTLPAEQGGTISLSQFRGQVVVLEFFAPWCPHCRNEVSTLNSLAHAYAAQGVEVLSVTATPYGFNYEATGDTSPISMADVRQFVSQFHVSYPALLDTSLKAGNAYGVGGFPQLFVLDRNGIVKWNNGVGGEVSYADLRAQIEKALAAPLATATRTGASETPAAATATPRR